MEEIEETGPLSTSSNGLAAVASVAHQILMLRMDKMMLRFIWKYMDQGASSFTDDGPSLMEDISFRYIFQSYLSEFKEDVRAVGEQKLSSLTRA